MSTSIPIPITGSTPVAQNQVPRKVVSSTPEAPSWVKDLQAKLQQEIEEEYQQPDQVFISYLINLIFHYILKNFFLPLQFEFVIIYRI